MSSKPKAAMKTRQQQREQSNQSNATHSSPLAISKTANVRELVLQLTRRFDKFTRHFDTFKGEVRSRLHFQEDKVQHIKDRFTYGDPRRPYVEKYANIEVDESLLTTDLAQNRWRAFVEMPTEDVPKMFHEAYSAGYFKLLLFTQDCRHWDVPKKESKLWNWLKNQRVLMREYESGTKVNKYTAHPRYYKF
jgi:hypothetical protein